MNKKKRKINFFSLALDIQRYILKYLTTSDLLTLKQVCKNTRTLVNDNMPGLRLKRYMVRNFDDIRIPLEEGKVGMCLYLVNDEGEDTDYVEYDFYNIRSTPASLNIDSGGEHIIASRFSCRRSRDPFNLFGRPITISYIENMISFPLHASGTRFRVQAMFFIPRIPLLREPIYIKQEAYNSLDWVLLSLRGTTP